MQIRFDGKTAVITGAAGGLGSRMARQFALDGARVAVCDKKGADRVATEITASGGIAAAYSFDITDRAQTGESLNRIGQDLGKIDILVNNAGINVGPDERKTVGSFSDEWWDAILRVDLDGTYNVTRLALPHFAENASVINISSIVGMVPLRNQCAFAAAKAGVINFSKAAAMELAPKGIRVNTVCPGTIGLEATNLLWQGDGMMRALLAHIPMSRQGTPEDIANAVEFLASDYASYITGAVLPVDGGWTCGGYARDF